MVGAPVRPADVTDVVAQQQRLQPEPGGVEIVQRVLAGAREIADGLVRHVGDVDSREIAGASQAGERHGVALVGLHSIARFARNQRGGDDEAREVLPGEITVEPVAAGPGLVDEHELRALAVHLANEGVNVALSRADGAHVHRIGGTLGGRVGDSNRVLVDVEADIQCATVSHG